MVGISENINDYLKLIIHIYIYTFIGAKNILLYINNYLKIKYI